MRFVRWGIKAFSKLCGHGMKREVEYLPDASVDAALDKELRALLATCFTSPNDAIFQKRRYWCEPYPHRWVVRDEQRALVAHVGVHEKRVETHDRTYRVGGICEVCVHPDYRGQGLVRLMLAVVHDWLIRHAYDFALLFGDPAVYGSSGYAMKDNLFQDVETKGRQKSRRQISGMVRQLSDTRWPTCAVLLPGILF
jgi:GNAT superfamily N-acetyltransferase